MSKLPSWLLRPRWVSRSTPSMLGYRKLALAVLVLLLSTLAVAQGWIEGLQYASIVTLVAGAYLGSNVAAKSVTSKT